LRRIGKRPAHPGRLLVAELVCGAAGTGYTEDVPRAIWSGSIVFGLVNAPVRMYSAIDEHDLELHLVHEKDGSRIGYSKVCKKEGKEVPSDEIVKAYEVSDGELVYLTDEDFQAAEEEAYKAIEVLDFVPYEEIDPIVFQRTYYLGPADGAEKVYSLLVRAMEESGLSAIARYVFHDRQLLGCLRVRDGVITLENMYYADEIRPIDDIAPKRQRVDRKELEMAETLIDRFTSKFDHSKYRDEYQDRLREIVKRKRKGEEVHAAAPEERKAPTDLLDALRESVEAAKSSRSKATSSSRNGRSKRKPSGRRQSRSKSRR
jgi:DNA end-binding protein Ku